MNDKEQVLSACSFLKLTFWLTKMMKISKMYAHGDLSEWFKVRCWKRRVANTHHEFESHSLRHRVLKAFIYRLVVSIYDDLG